MDFNGVNIDSLTTDEMLDIYDEVLEQGDYLSECSSCRNGYQTCTYGYTVGGDTVVVYKQACKS